MRYVNRRESECLAVWLRTCAIVTEGRDRDRQLNYDRDVNRSRETYRARERTRDRHWIGSGVSARSNEISAAIISTRARCEYICTTGPTRRRSRPRPQKDRSKANGGYFSLAGESEILLESPRFLGASPRSRGTAETNSSSFSRTEERAPFSPSFRRRGASLRHVSLERLG